MTPFNNHLIFRKIFIILYHSYCCYVNTPNNMFANSSCTFLLISIQYTVLHILLYCTFYFIFYSFLFFFFSPYLYLCILSCVCIPYNCTVHGADLTYISLLVVIFCIIVYETNTKSWILNHCRIITYERRMQWRTRVERVSCLKRKRRLSVSLFQSDRGQNGECLTFLHNPPYVNVIRLISNTSYSVYYTQKVNNCFAVGIDGNRSAWVFCTWCVWPKGKWQRSVLLWNLTTDKLNAF